MKQRIEKKRLREDKKIRRVDGKTGGREESKWRSGGGEGSRYGWRADR